MMTTLAYGCLSAGKNFASVKSLQDFVLNLAEKIVHGVQPSPASRRSL